MKFFYEKGLDGSCQNNWFSVIGANGGMQVVPSMCGERRGQSSKILILSQWQQNIDFYFSDDSCPRASESDSSCWCPDSQK